MLLLEREAIQMKLLLNHIYILVITIIERVLDWSVDSVQIVRQFREQIIGLRQPETAVEI